MPMQHNAIEDTTFSLILHAMALLNHVAHNWPQHTSRAALLLFGTLLTGPLTGAVTAQVLLCHLRMEEPSTSYFSRSCRLHTTYQAAMAASASGQQCPYQLPALTAFLSAFKQPGHNAHAGGLKSSSRTVFVTIPGLGLDCLVNGRSRRSSGQGSGKHVQLHRALPFASICLTGNPWSGTSNKAQPLMLLAASPAAPAALTAGGKGGDADDLPERILISEVRGLG